jgi:hypothetical protein
MNQTDPLTDEERAAAGKALQEMLSMAAYKPGLAFLEDPTAVRARLERTMQLLYQVMDIFAYKQANSYVKVEHVMLCRMLETEVFPKLVDLTEAAAFDLGLIPAPEEERADNF